MRRYPVAALIAWCAERGISQNELARRGWELNSYSRRNGLSWEVADRVAVTILDAHPGEIWLDWFDNDNNEEAAA